MRRIISKFSHWMRPERTWRRILMEMSSDAMLLVGRNGKVLEANQSACDLGGWTQQALMSRRLDSIVAPDDRKTVVEVMQHMTEPRRVPGKIFLQDTKGELTPTEWRLVPASKTETFFILRDLRAFSSISRYTANKGVELLPMLERVGEAVSQLWDLTSILEHCLQEAALVAGCDVGVVTTLDPQTGKLSLAAQHGLPAGSLQQAIESLPPDGHLLGQATSDRVEVVCYRSLNMAPLAPAILDLLQKEQIQSLLLFHVIHRGKILAEVNLGVRRPNILGDVDTRAIRVVASQMSQAIFSARLCDDLNQKNIQLQHVLEDSPIGIFAFEFQSDGAKVTLANRCFADFVGLPLEQLINGRLEEVRPALLRSLHSEKPLESLLGEGGAQPEIEDRGRVVLKGRHNMTLEYFTRPMRDDFKHVVGRVWIFSQIPQ